MNQYTVEDLLRQLMLGAEESYQQKEPISGTGFVVGEESLARRFEYEYCADEDRVSESPGQCRRVLGLIPAPYPITSLSSLRRFAATIRNIVQMSEGEMAGIMCEFPVSLDGAPTEPNILLYVDQKFGGVRVCLAPLSGKHLVFRDLGTASPRSNFLPNLIPIEAYGPITAEA